MTLTRFQDGLELRHRISVLLGAQNGGAVAIIAIEGAVAFHCKVGLVKHDGIVRSRCIVVQEASRLLIGWVAFVGELHFLRIDNNIICGSAVSREITQGEGEARLAIHSIYFIILRRQVVPRVAGFPPHVGTLLLRV